MCWEMMAEVAFVRCVKGSITIWYDIAFDATITQTDPSPEAAASCLIFMSGNQVIFSQHFPALKMVVDVCSPYPYQN